MGKEFKERMLFRDDKVKFIDFNSKKEEISFQDVGGLEKLKKSISIKIIKPFKNPDLFAKFKKKVGGGILLYGPPGCGKSFIARATSGECNAKFINVGISEILSCYYGESAKNIHSIFEKARDEAPSILFFDELDTLGFSRSKTTSDNNRSVIDQLLNELDGVNNNNKNILILAATNTPWDIDSALKRSGRFDRTLFVPPPDKEARKVIFRLKLKEKPIDNINYDILAEKTELFSGADIEGVIEEATENVLDEILESDIERNINTDDILKVIIKKKPTTIDWLRTVDNYIKYGNQSGFYDDVEEYIKKNRKYL